MSWCSSSIENHTDLLHSAMGNVGLIDTSSELLWKPRRDIWCPVAQKLYIFIWLLLQIGPSLLLLRPSLAITETSGKFWHQSISVSTQSAIFRAIANFRCICNICKINWISLFKKVWIESVANSTCLMRNLHNYMASLRLFIRIIDLRYWNERNESVYCFPIEQL